MSKYDDLVAKWTTSLTEKRLLMNQWASAAVKQYDSLPQDVRDRLPALPGRTAQEMVPALYAGTITQAEVEAYKVQYDALERFVAACNAEVERLNQSEAVRCKLS